jgi:hypothetical protein
MFNPDDPKSREKYSSAVTLPHTERRPDLPVPFRKKIALPVINDFLYPG